MEEWSRVMPPFIEGRGTAPAVEGFVDGNVRQTNLQWAEIVATQMCSERKKAMRGKSLSSLLV